MYMAHNYRYMQSKENTVWYKSSQLLLSILSASVEEEGTWVDTSNFTFAKI